MAAIVAIAIYYVMELRKVQVQWGDMRYGILMLLAGYAIRRLAARKPDERTWKPNVVRKNFWSETFHKMLRFRMTATVVKKIKRLHHGIDEYLMRSPDAMLRFPAAIQLKRDLLKERQEIVHEVNFSVAQQHEGIFQHHFHVLGIGDEVG